MKSRGQFQSNVILGSFDDPGEALEVCDIVIYNINNVMSTLDAFSSDRPWIVKITCLRRR